MEVKGKAIKTRLVVILGLGEVKDSVKVEMIKFEAATIKRYIYMDIYFI